MAAAEFKSLSFQLLSENELQHLLEGTDATSTKRSIRFGIAKFEAFLRLKQLELAEIAAAERPRLDGVLREFYASLRREDGSWYSKKSMQAIRYGVLSNDKDPYVTIL